ncbi:MAG: exodeoxyribonuclease VII small subunit [Candidatus Cloacimonetes bacterium]|nr:exodeoxyribonuclease VII small subunit [Candidatus Cloacimonadota bacterium]
MKNERLKFETALNRLEEIVARLESGVNELDEAVKLFEEGSRLIELCQKKLTDVETKIEKISRSDKASEDTDPDRDEV